MVKPGDINQQQQFANDAVQAYKDTQAKKAETSKAIEDNATRFAKGGISSGMSTGNKALDKMQQVKREKQPKNTQPQNSNYDVKYDNKGRIVSITPKNTQPQTMYDRNGNRIIQGNGRFERAQGLAAGQDQQFQNPTGYDIGAVTNQVTQNNQLQATHQTPAQVSQNNQARAPQGTQGMPGGFNLLSYRTNNRRFNNGMNYLNNTFAGKRVTLDDGTQVDASKYFQDRMAKVLAHSNNPKALMHYMRSIQEDMARRGVGNFDISGELLKGTGMTDRGMANVLFQNKAAILQQLQPTSSGGQKPIKQQPVKPQPVKPQPIKQRTNTKADNYMIQQKYASDNPTRNSGDLETVNRDLKSLAMEYRKLGIQMPDPVTEPIAFSDFLKGPGALGAIPDNGSGDVQKWEQLIAKRNSLLRKYGNYRN